MTFQRLEAIATAHYLTKKYENHKLYMSRALSARLMQRYKPDLGERELTKLRDTVFGKPLLYELMGVPVINDVGITNERNWLLVDGTGEVVEVGWVEPLTCYELDSCVMDKSCANYINCKEVVTDADASEDAAVWKASGAQAE